MTGDERQRHALEIEKIRATIANLNVETERNIRENRYPPVVLAALILGVAGPVAALLLSLWLVAP